jgi:O-antigen ligase
MTSVIMSEPHRTRLVRTADWLAVAVAMSLPWSTSATGILIAIWAIVLLPVVDWRDLRDVVATLAGGLPVLLVLLGVAGMLWAGVNWHERWDGLSSFLKLLAIPLLFVQFRQSEHGLWVFAAFAIACILVLLLSTAFWIYPGSQFLFSHDRAVPVKNAATQSGEFVACIFCFLYLVLKYLERRRWVWLLGLIAVIFAMLANILYVASGRTALVTVLVLLPVFAFRQLRLRGAVLFAISAAIVGTLVWSSSPYLRHGTSQIWTDYQKYEATDQRNSSGERLEFWKKSLEFVRSAPVIGHGTGSIHAMFLASAAGKTGAGGVASSNPHNQTLAVAIQLGMLGAVALWAMWIAHISLFRGGGLAVWIGLVVVLQNIVGSLFNSHLFDFGQGWIYVFGIGVAGGIALKNDISRKSDDAVL